MNPQHWATINKCHISISNHISMNFIIFKDEVHILKFAVPYQPGEIWLLNSGILADFLEHHHLLHFSKLLNVIAGGLLNFLARWHLDQSKFRGGMAYLADISHNGATLFFAAFGLSGGRA